MVGAELNRLATLAKKGRRRRGGKREGINSCYIEPGRASDTHKTQAKMGRIGREKHYTSSAHLSTCLPASVINHPVRFPELLQLFQWEGVCVTPGRGRRQWPGSLSDVGSSDSGCVSSASRAVQNIRAGVVGQPCRTFFREQHVGWTRGRK
jgi:hypothetical protein